MTEEASVSFLIIMSKVFGPASGLLLRLPLVKKEPTKGVLEIARHVAGKRRKEIDIGSDT